MSRNNGISRRTVLQAGMAGGLLGALSRTSYGVAPPWMQASQEKLLLIFLRGGYDVANTIIPANDPAYNPIRRPTLFMPDSQTIPIVGNPDFKLNPALAPVSPLVNSGRLVFVHAAGNTARTGSHFEDMRTWETAIDGCNPSSLDPEEGWVTRAISETLPGGGFKAASCSNGLQQFFRTRPGPNGGFNPDRVLAHVKALRDYPGDSVNRYSLSTNNDPLDNKLKGNLTSAPMLGLRALFGNGSQPTHHKDAFARSVGNVLLESEARISQQIPTPYVPAGGAQYPFGLPGALLPPTPCLLK